MAIQTRDIQALIQVYAEGLDLMAVLTDSVSTSINPLVNKADFQWLWKEPFENIVGKGENAGSYRFLLFRNVTSQSSTGETHLKAPHFESL